VSRDLEAERQEDLAEMDQDDPGWREHYGPGSLGRHEAAHLAGVVAELVRQELHAHPALALDARCYELAAEAATALDRLSAELRQERP
jgi:hypothetical protein